MFLSISHFATISYKILQLGHTNLACIKLSSYVYHWKQALIFVCHHHLWLVLALLTLCTILLLAPLYLMMYEKHFLMNVWAFFIKHLYKWSVGFILIKWHGWDPIGVFSMGCISLAKLRLFIVLFYTSVVLDSPKISMNFL